MLYIFGSFLSSFLSIYILSIYAKSLKLLDIPNGRSMHTKPKVRGAGIGVFFVFFISLALFNQDFLLQNIYIFLSIMIVFVTGAFDDIYEISARYKFIMIAFATLILIFLADMSIDTLGVWFGYELKLPFTVALFLTLFAVSGFTNAFNLIDGIDGLAGGIALVILSGFLYMGVVYHDKFLMTVPLFLIPAIMAFLLFNWYPSKIFLGDSGSLTLGFIISVLSIKLIEHVSIVSVLIFAALPIVDTLYVIQKRLRMKVSPFKADKNHIHHKALKKMGSVPLTSITLIAIQTLFTLIAIMISGYKNEVILFGLLLLSAVVVIYRLNNNRLHRLDESFSFEVNNFNEAQSHQKKYYK